MQTVTLSPPFRDVSYNSFIHENRRDEKSINFFPHLYLDVLETFLLRNQNYVMFKTQCLDVSFFRSFSELCLELAHFISG